MARTGRPQVNIDKKQFENLCSIQATEEEIAGWFKCSVDTINRWCKRVYKQTFAEVYNIYNTQGKISIRRYQFQHAQKNAGMAVYLGKVYLGQKVKSENEPEVTSKLLKALEAADKDNI